MHLGVPMAGLALAMIPALADAHNCKCRNRCVLFALGETSCLRVDGTIYLARCEMKLNVSSWTKLQDGCPVTGIAPPTISAVNWSGTTAPHRARSRLHWTRSAT